MLGRREFLYGSVTTIGLGLTASCADSTTSSNGSAIMPSEPPDGALLLVFFSRAGENYSYGGRTNLTVGNTEVAAGMIRAAIACDTYQIHAVDPYPDAYAPTVERNVRELNDDARPAIAEPLPSIDSYDRIILASPVWASRAPRIMLTFAERFDFSGKTVFPLTTYAVSGLGGVVEDYRNACKGATFREALAVRGEEVGDSGAAIESWLRRTGILV